MIWNASPPIPRNSSPSSFNALSLIYSQLVSSYRDITREMYKFDHYLEYLLYPLAPSSTPSILFLQDLFPNMFIDYHQALTMINSDSLTFPNPVSIICFPLSPKPHEICETTPWMKQWWQENLGRESTSVDVVRSEDQNLSLK
jgi:hypothetical protein